MIPTKTYRAIDFKQPLFIFYILLITTLSIYLLGIAFTSVHKEGKEGIAILVIFLSLIAPSAMLHAWDKKVIIDKDQIILKSLFYTKKMKFSDIKSFALYELERGATFNKIIGEDYKQCWWSNLSYIFLSYSQEFNPNSFKRGKSMMFSYRKELYEDIKKYMNMIHS